MTDLTTYVPDTSQYTDPADRLIALALLVKSGRPLQYMHQSQTTFHDDTEGVTSVTRALVSCLMAGSDYRAKPEPRVVWVNFNRGKRSGGISAAVYESENDAQSNPHNERIEMRIATAVRVELPDDQ